MILFKTDKNIEIDLSAYGVSLNEESNLFSNSINKSYSLPFSINTDDELAGKLGLPFLDNITGVETKVRGNLILPDRYYPATLFLGEIVGSSIECQISYGDEELAVYDLQLKDLPWPVVLSPNLRAYAENVIKKDWPATAFNFPMVYAPKIADGSDYEDFKGFMNNHNWGFLENITEVIGDETFYRNYNVMAPFPYLLEILRFGFSLEGKTISGPAVENALLRKVLYIPDTYLERFRGSEFQSFSFGMPDEVINEQNSAIYRRQFTAEFEGTYDLKFNLNLDPVTAQHFELKVLQIDPGTNFETVLYLAKSENNRVKIEKDLKVNITPDTTFDTIRIELTLNYQPESIAAHNQFEFLFNDGRLNEFPTYFSLANFMPDLDFGQFVNELKNWLNLDFTIGDAIVNIDFTQDSILLKPREDHSHLEIPKPNKKHNSNRFYKLSYANGSKVFYNASGQIYSELEEEGDEIISIEMDVQPAVVEQNMNVLTAVMPENRSAIDFCVFESVPLLGRPVCSATLIRQLFLQNVFLSFWALWLFYRVHSKSFKESFDCSVYEHISIDELSHKYKELHVIKKLQRKFLSEKTMKVTLESETF